MKKITTITVVLALISSSLMLTSCGKSDAEIAKENAIKAAEARVAATKKAGEDLQYKYERDIILARANGAK